MNHIETSSTGNNGLMSIQEMWDLTKGDKNWGIEGYDPVRKYYDGGKEIKLREREKTIKENKDRWPPSDWPKIDKGSGEKVPVPPKRPNYLDQVYKWSKSYYDPEKAQKIIDDLDSKGRPFDKRKEKIVVDPKKLFETSQKEKQDRDANYSDYPKFDLKIEWIDKAKERIKAQQEKWEKNEKEKKLISSLPRADRITVVSDAQYLGEKIPFYNTVKKEEEEQQSEDNKKKKKRNSLFFPDVDIIFK